MNSHTGYSKALRWALLVASLGSAAIAGQSCGTGFDPLKAYWATPAPLTFFPTSGPVGTLVTISGMDFSTTQSVSIGGVNAIPISQSSGSLVVFVMPGASRGQIIVTTSNGTFSGASSFNVTSTGIPVNQKGAKLVGTGAVGAAAQGLAVAISADGNTALIGGYQDNSNAGAAWVFIRNGGGWTQQGAKLVGTGATGAAQQGAAVALSADGNTALIGGIQDNSNTGATWVFTRNGGVWTQQGAKLVGTGAVGAAEQGYSVSLSADGNTALIGGVNDNSFAGAAWVFTRSGSVWTQQGAKLVGTGASGGADQGQSVCLSADGNTALIGGPSDNSHAGAAWVFARSAGIWAQQGVKLVGAGAVGAAWQGVTVALNADGNTALVGGYTDNSNAGASWAFIRSGGTWTQQGAKLVGTGAVGVALQGVVSLSADGNTALIGGPFDNSNAGATWVFARSGGVWTQQGAKLVGTGAVGAALQGTVSLSADGNTALIGGYSDNSTAGAAWMFTP